MASRLFCEIDLFRNVAQPCLQGLLENSRILDVGAGHLFFGAGQAGKELLLLEKGSVQTFRVCNDRKIAIATLRPPTVFGELGCFGGRHYFSAESREESRVRLVAYTSIEALLECSPNLIHGVIGLICERFDRFVREFETHSRKGTLPRLAALLLKKREDDLVRGLTHKNLGEELGIHRESVTLALGELQKAGIIRIGRKQIHILQLARLERAARE